MKINDDHMYHGAALTQIAEHSNFSSINAFQIARKASRSSFVINNNVGIYIKYASRPVSQYQQFGFTFTKDNFKEIKKLAVKYEQVYIVLVCVEAREICCISNEELKEFTDSRKQAKGQVEEIFTLIVTAQAGKSLRVYVNLPNSKGRKIGEKTVPRNRFPSAIFD